MSADNAFDEGWLEWFASCYRTTAQAMPDDQRRQLECAFFAGAAFGGRVAQEHGHDVVIEAIQAHIARTKREDVFCQRCHKTVARAALLDGEACPTCRLVL